MRVYVRTLKVNTGKEDSVAQQLPRVTAGFGTSYTCDDFVYKTYQENELFPLQKH